MNWLTKFLSFFVGDDEKEIEKEIEKDEVRAQRDQRVNQNSIASDTNSLDQSNHKAEARVSYQYPKGNFKFPLIPDEKNYRRGERPTRTPSTYNQSANSNGAISIPKPTTYRPAAKVESELVDEGAESKRPYQPTVIPSPVYGLKSRDESIWQRPQLNFEKRGNQDLSLSTKGEKPSSQIYGSNLNQEPGELSQGKNQLKDKQMNNPAKSRQQDASFHDDKKNEALSVQKETIREENRYEQPFQDEQSQRKVFNKEEVRENQNENVELVKADTETHQVDWVSEPLNIPTLRVEETFSTFDHQLDQGVEQPQKIAQVQAPFEMEEASKIQEPVEIEEKSEIQETVGVEEKFEVQVPFEMEEASKFQEPVEIEEKSEIQETVGVEEKFEVQVPFEMEEASKFQESIEIEENSEIQETVGVEEKFEVQAPFEIEEVSKFQEPIEIEENSEVQEIVGVEEKFEVQAPFEMEEASKFQEPVEIEEKSEIQEIATDQESEPFHQFPLGQEAQSSEQLTDKASADIVSNSHYSNRNLDADSGKEKQRENKTKSMNALPYNVMMLGSDKQQLKARENRYQFPMLTYLNVPEREHFEDQSWLNEQRELLDVTLKNFNVRANVVNVTQGPAVTRFEVHPEPGVKVNKITNLSDDIKLSLAAKDIRIEAPIPGKNTIGIEVPNKESKMVYLREILRSQEFRTNPSPMTAVLGLDISGQPAVTDLKKMPHGLIAGATGSGKSVCINTILISLLYKASPHEVKLMLIDPKMVELAPYNDIPHLVSPVITDVKAATAALKWAVEEMERRYELFVHSGTREITRYNQLVKEHNQGEHLPYLVIIIDELADLMMVAPNDVEEAIARIAQKARACGIHLIVATQRPSVDVITGLIKANIPTRIAFSVSSQVDSRTILDVSGAEKLLGKGDMLFLENGSSKSVRLQGSYVSDEEIERVVNHVKQQAKPNYLFHQEELVKKATIQSEEDELFLEACEFVVNQGGASSSLLQRRFRIGYNRAARLIDMMEEQGIISENKGSKPRDILISEEELDSIHENSAY